MASIRLGRYEVEDYDLPKVCMRCGARAVTYKQRRFRWFPRWLIVTFPLGILPTEITERSITLKGVCEEFIEALEADRRGDARGDDRPRRKRPRDDDEDDRPRAKRRAADEDDGGYYDPDAKRRRRDREDDE